MNIRHTAAIAIGALLLLCVQNVGFSQAPGAPAIGGQVRATSITVENARVRIIHELEVAAQSDGLLLQLFADEGQTVAEGTEILKIDSRVAAADVKVSEKELEAAEEQAKQTADIEYAEASYKVSSAELADMKELEKRNAASFSEVRRAQLEAERSRLAIMAARVKHNQDALARDVAKEKLAAANVRLELYSVLAPMEGLITERLKDRGEWVRAGEPILKMVHLNQMKIEAKVPVDQVSPSQLLGATMNVKVQLSPYDQAEFTSVVEFVSPVILADFVSVWTRVNNEPAYPGGPWLLRDGMKAEATITLK